METYDDELIKRIDQEMGWIEEDGSCPSKTASELGYHCKFMDGPFSATAWIGPEKVWSVCVLIGIRTTLLARSFKALDRMYRKLCARQANPNKWQTYYHALWERRYRKWLHTEQRTCNCQLCRMGKTKVSRQFLSAAGGLKSE